MAKDKILSRLLEDGYITFKNLDILINKKTGFTRIIQELFNDCKITSKESIIILTDNYIDRMVHPVHPSKVDIKYLPYGYPTGPSDYPGAPPSTIYYQTTTFDKTEE